MGQLEKYGLYVMCLVIFLILGVSLWDVRDAPSSKQQTPSVTNVARVGGGDALRGDGGGNLSADEIDDLFEPMPRGRGPNQEPRPPANSPGGGSGNGAGGGTPSDASAVRGDGKPVDAEAQKAPAPEPKRAVHKVRDGDTFDSIARTKLGDAALRIEIERLNPNIRPTRLRVGQEIVLPSAAELTSNARSGDAGATKTKATPSAERVYTVRKGDNFERIARTQLGDSRRVDELRELNPGIEDTKLRIGQSLKLPKK